MNFDLRRAQIQLKIAHEQLRLRKDRLARKLACGTDAVAEMDIVEAESDVELARLAAELAQVDVDELTVSAKP